MKYLKTINQDIENLCREYGIRNWNINGDGLVDVDNHVVLSHKGLGNIPIRFGKVSGYFNCSNNKLTSLEGCPKEIGGWFDCSDNQISSLKCGPYEVSDFYCPRNQLTSLEGCPKDISGSFNCYNNKLTSLKGSPQKIGYYFDCSQNQLTSLEGCPEKVCGKFDCSVNQLTIIDYLPEWIDGYISFSNNKIRDIRVERKSYVFNNRCYLDYNPINEEFKKWNGDLIGFIKNLNRLRKINEILENI